MTELFRVAFRQAGLFAPDMDLRLNCMGQRYLEYLENGAFSGESLMHGCTSWTLRAIGWLELILRRCISWDS